MTITIRDGSKGVTIRATGCDAARVRHAIASALVPEGAENGPEVLPNDPKANSRGTGAPLALRIALAARSKGVR